ASFTIPAATGCRKFFVTVVGTCWRSIIADRDDACVFGKYSPYMLFDTVRPFGQIYSQFHENIVKIRSRHSRQGRKVREKSNKVKISDSKINKKVGSKKNNSK